MGLVGPAAPAVLRPRGTPVFAEPQDGPWIAVSLTTLDDPAALSPGSHIWVSEKRAWVRIDDGLAQFDRGA